jgi:hypothetical protein
MNKEHYHGHWINQCIFIRPSFTSPSGADCSKCLKKSLPRPVYIAAVFKVLRPMTRMTSKDSKPATTVIAISKQLVNKISETGSELVLTFNSPEPLANVVVLNV